MRPLSIVIALIFASESAFAQENFENVLERTLREHPRILEAQAMFSGERAMRAEALSPYRPMVSANGTFATGSGSMVFPTTVSPLNFAVLPRDGVALGNLTLMWKVWSGGRDSLTSKAWSARVQASEHMLTAVKLDVALDLRLAIYDHEFAVGVVGARESAVRAAERSEQTAREREEVGEVPNAYVLRAVSVTMKARSELAMARANAAGSKARLDEAAGFSVAEISHADESDNQGPQSLEEALSLGVQRDEVTYFALMARAKGLDMEVSGRSLLPEVSLMAMGDSMQTSDGMNDSGAKVGVVVSVPIIDGGMRKSLKDAARAEASKFEAQLEIMKLSINREIASAWAEWIASQSMVASAMAGLASAEESLLVERLRFENGEAIMSELLEAQAMLAESEVAVLEARRFAESAKAMLLRAIGSKSLLNK